jgi:peptide-methionine (S)-S-oxide reductase
MTQRDGSPESRESSLNLPLEGGDRSDGHRSTDAKQIATLGGGCFWCLEAVYDELNGVESVTSGYAGGDVVDPSYEAVCMGTTGHAEVVQIAFDASVVSFRELIEVFFTIHDPTTLNRQGPDAGTQYRSVIFYDDAEQERVAEDVIREITGAALWQDPIVTEVTPLARFYEAEEYHQKYFEKNPFQPYCLVMIRPKVAKLRKEFLSKLKKQTA